MSKSLSLYIGSRYTRSRSRRGFVSFISMVSMLGIALGVLVLITVLSVMNGFNNKVRKEYFALAPEVTVTGPAAANWNLAKSVIASDKNITASAPFVSGQGMISSGQSDSGVMVLGIDPQAESKISALKSKMIAGSLNSLNSKDFNVVIGKSLADNLGLVVGQRITLITPQVSATPFGAMPRFKRFTISGIFHAGGGFGYDDGVIYIGLQQGKKLFVSNASYGLHLRLTDPYLADPITIMLEDKLTFQFAVSNWASVNGAFFDALSLQKTTMFFVLTLIIAVAVFNLVSSLMMMVNDKRSDIAILRTIGASPGLIMRAFIVQGTLIGGFGTLLGIVLGVILSLNVTDVVNFLETVLHLQIINPTAFYGLSYLPSELVPSDIALVAAMSFGLSLLATLYPAWSAFRVEPAEALRYE
jgi:lipoprotein-releasing system permease protein